MLTHHNLIANLLQFEACESDFWEKGPGDTGSNEVLMSPLPFFHIYGAIASLNLTLLHGAKLVTMPAFDLEKFLSLVQEEKCTRAHLVPPIILGLAKHPIIDNYDLSSLTCIISAAAPLGEDTESACQARLGAGVILKQGYGMSELSPVASLVPDDGLRPGTGTVGPPVASMSFKIIDLETGEVLPPGEEGELCCKGPNVMKGYLNNDAATAGCLDEEGWLQTGDIGFLTEEGYLTITDRLKELIKYKGFQVAPAELEDMLLSHPKIIDAAVIPRLDDEAGEVPLAFVVLSPAAVEAGGEGAPTPEEIAAFVAAKVAPHKQLRGGVMVIDAIPKSPTGKLLRRVLVEREKAGEFR
jgi:acyl-CoA synthetase (AMP-forming)/AMP-acid ligase II